MAIKTPAAPPRHNYRWWIAALILGLGLALAWMKIRVPLSYDETATINYFAGLPYNYIVTNYRVPNNHIAFSVILHTWSLVIRDHNMVRTDTAILRVPSLLFFTLGVVAFFLACRRLVSRNPIVAAAATLFFICQPGVLDYSLRLRGYGLSVALLCAMLALVCYQERMRRWIFAPLLALTILVFNYTVPTNIWFSLALAPGIILWPLVFHRRAGAIWWAIGAVIAGFVATALAYMPILPQLTQLSGGVAHDPVAMAHSLVTNGPQHLRFMLGANLYFIGAWATGAMLVAGLAAIAIGARRKNRARRAAMLAALPALLCPIAAGLLGPPAFERNYVVIAPIIALLGIWAVIGLVGLARRVAARAGWSVSPQVLTRGAAAILILVSFYHGVRHVLYYNKDIMPDKIAHFVAQNFPGVGLTYGWEADPGALYYYCVAENFGDLSAYYENLNQNMTESIKTFMILAGNDELPKIADHFKLAERNFGLRPIRNFGKLTLYWVARRARQ